MRIFILLITLWAVEVNSYRTGDCYECRTKEYIRIKRGKYFSNPPSKFYDRPPYSPSIKGPFSYTPPPGYTPNDIGPPHHSPSRRRPYKVSKRPDEGLGDEDIHNIIKYLSNKDLNKLIEIAMESKRYTGSNQQAESTLNEDVNKRNNEHENTKYFMGGLTNTEKYVPYSIQNNRNTNYFTNSHQVPEYKPNTELTDSSWQEQVSFLDAYIQKELNEKTQEKINMYTNSESMQREKLPNTSDLHSHDFDASFTNNIPNVIKVASSYDIKNFANLPLMNNENSKLDTVNSYEVPHYTVTSSKLPSSQMSLQNQQPSPTLLLPLSPSSLSIKTPEVEMAPAPESVAKDQSEAHLKAIKIWTHKSKGVAYTVLEDGTLTLERPSKTSNKNG